MQIICAKKLQTSLSINYKHDLTIINSILLYYMYFFYICSRVTNSDLYNILGFTENHEIRYNIHACYNIRAKDYIIYKTAALVDKKKNGWLEGKTVFLFVNTICNGMMMSVIGIWHIMLSRRPSQLTWRLSANADFPLNEFVFLFLYIIQLCVHCSLWIATVFYLCKVFLYHLVCSLINCPYFVLLSNVLKALVSEVLFF